MAAMKCGRNSIGVEIERKYARMAARRLMAEKDDLFSSSDLECLNAYSGENSNIVCVKEDATAYGVMPKKKRSPQATGRKRN